VTHIVHRQVAALVLHLGGHHHDLSLVHRLADQVIKLPLVPRRDAAHAETLHQNPIALRQGKGQIGRRQAGDQLHQGNPLVQGVEKPGGRAGRGQDVRHQTPLLHHPQDRVVDAGEGAKALGIGLPGPGSQDHRPAEHHCHPG